MDLTLGEASEAQTAALTSELEKCEACRAEHLAIASTLRVSRQALSQPQGSNEFWAGYHQRLQSKLNETASTVIERSPRATFWNSLKAYATSSVRVPLPAALAVLALISVLSLVALSRGEVNSIPSAPLARVEVQTVHVPVIQEKIVTQVVYRDRKRAKASAVDYANLNTATANVQPVANPRAKLNLVGFKPADQVKMTIIKGNDQNEK